MVRNVTAVSHSFSVDLDTLELGISDASLGRIDSRGGASPGVQGSNGGARMQSPFSEDDASILSVPSDAAELPSSLAQFGLHPMLSNGVARNETLQQGGGDVEFFEAYVPMQLGEIDSADFSLASADFDACGMPAMPDEAAGNMETLLFSDPLLMQEKTP